MVHYLYTCLGSGGALRFSPLLVAFWYSFNIYGCTLYSFHLVDLINVFILGLWCNKGNTLLSFSVMTFHYVFLTSLEIRFLLQRTTYQCYMCYLCPFQQAQMGKLHIDISQPVLSKG